MSPAPKAKRTDRLELADQNLALWWELNEEALEQASKKLEQDDG